MNTIIPSWELPSVPVVGSEARFPVRRIYCVGRNYAEHAREMGGNPDREPPFFFMKPADAVLTGERMDYPSKTDDLQHEVELVVALARGGCDIPAASALDCVFGYAVGLDMTRRDIQGELKAKGRSWEMGKAFDQSAPISSIMPASRIGHPQRGAITLKVNSQSRQHGDLSDMIWPVADIIAMAPPTSGVKYVAPIRTPYQVEACASVWPRRSVRPQGADRGRRGRGGRRVQYRHGL